MLKKRYPVLLILLALLSACAGAKPTVKPALHDADLYPNAQTTAGLTIAVDEITDGERSRQYFGRDLTRDGILRSGSSSRTAGTTRFWSSRPMFCFFPATA